MGTGVPISEGEREGLGQMGGYVRNGTGILISSSDMPM